MPPFSLATERLILRDFVEDDWQAVHEYGSDEEKENWRSSYLYAILSREWQEERLAGAG